MSIRTALFAYLKQASVTAAIGAGAAARLYPHFAGQARAMPLLVVRRVSTARPYSLLEVGMQRITRFHFEGWGKSMAEVDAMMDLLEADLHAWVGEWDDVVVKRAVQEGPDFDDDDEPSDATDVPDFRTLQQWSVAYQKAA